MARRELVARVTWLRHSDAPSDFVINLKAAKALALTIPPSLLQRADQVIE